MDLIFGRNLYTHQGEAIPTKEDRWLQEMRTVKWRVTFDIILEAEPQSCFMREEIQINIPSINMREAPYINFRYGKPRINIICLDKIESGQDEGNP
jgi:hypothetical protein